VLVKITSDVDGRRISKEKTLKESRFFKNVERKFKRLVRKDKTFRS
jgi:hypothetical protein